MVRRDRTNERLVALFLLGSILLLPPVLLVFNRPVRVLGVPLLHLYIFAAWVALIALAALIVRRIDPEPADPAGTTDKPPGPAEGAHDA